jgi:hypothetical protein
MLQLQFRNRALKCDVCGPDPVSGNYWLRFNLFTSEGYDKNKHQSCFEILPEVVLDLPRHGVRETNFSCTYEPDAKSFVLLVTFEPKYLMKAYEYQLSFGQQGPGHAR